MRPVRMERRRILRIRPAKPKLNGLMLLSRLEKLKIDIKKIYVEKIDINETEANKKFGPKLALKR